MRECFGDASRIHRAVEVQLDPEAVDGGDDCGGQCLGIDVLSKFDRGPGLNG